MTSMFALWAGALLFFGGPVTEVSITPMNEQTSVLIAIDGDVEFRDFLMEGPHRLINGQPWDVALDAILFSNGLVAQEDENGIIRVSNVADLDAAEQVERLLTVAYPVNFATAGEVSVALTPLLTERGQITVAQGTNTVVVSNIERVQEAVAQLLIELDVETPQVSISAKIIFVNRTDLAEFGVTYEVKDSRGNQFNQLSEGLADLDGDGVLETIGGGARRELHRRARKRRRRGRQPDAPVAGLAGRGPAPARQLHRRATVGEPQ